MNPLEIEPDLTQKLTKIGAQLRETRQQRHISLEEISAKTMIPIRLLSAIEEGRMDCLPEVIYTKGFIRRFADTLGLNGANLADIFSGQASVEQPQDDSNIKKRQQKGGRLRGGLRPVHLYLLYIVLILSAGVGLSYLTNPSAFTSASDSPSTPGATVPPSQPSQPKYSAPFSQAQTAPKSAKPVASAIQASTPKSNTVRVDLSIKEASWLKIVVDGKVSYEGTLSPGVNKTIVAKKQLIIQAGNAGGVMVAVNQKPAKPMGESGAVEELTLEAASLSGKST
ncbi:MAG: helix-turn-helix domain-containing protein [Acaryochloris sp. RU_4_1]|nr:helix-turn-helix domain-containing protein [Acaryochloris sp. RU_4_1]NJN38943.1 helix-turn-helix domain-containing protein [Acaryochloridaceae cyanobacterium CSU_3_4]NJR55055.1 helix-turn-helix domain-containing protein [Acaryochloris sp. CRU_2_0]